MKNKSKLNRALLVIIIIILLIVGLVYFFDNSKQKENNISSNNSVRVSCTSDKGKIMTYQRALEIAKDSSCFNVGKFTGEYGCNQNAGGLIDVYMSPSNKPMCGFACRISIDTEKAEEGWMCTGASFLTQ